MAIVDGLAIIGAERCLMELADWCDATVNMVEGRSDPLELAAVAAAARFWWLQNRVTEVAEAATRMATVVGDPDHHLSLAKSATEAMLDLNPSRLPEAIQRLHDALTRYGSEHPTWWTAQVAILLVLLGGLDDSSVAPVIEQIGSPVLSAKFTFARAMPFTWLATLVPPSNSPDKPQFVPEPPVQRMNSRPRSRRREAGAHDSPTPPPPTSSPPSPNHSNYGTVSASPGVAYFRLKRSPRP